MDPAVITGISGASATILAAIIGVVWSNRRYNKGKDEGFEEGRKHSILKFLGVHEANIDSAVAAIERGDLADARAKCVAIVETVRTWRAIQSRFAELLDGIVDRLEEALRIGDPGVLAEPIRAMRQAYRAQRLAVETELERSSI